MLICNHYFHAVFIQLSLSRKSLICQMMVWNQSSPISIPAIRYIYIYIYRERERDRQTETERDCFVVSQLITVVRYVICFKLGSTSE